MKKIIKDGIKGKDFSSVLLLYLIGIIIVAVPSIFTAILFGKEVTMLLTPIFVILTILAGYGYIFKSKD